MKKMYVFAVAMSLAQPAAGWAEEQEKAEVVPAMEEVVVTASKTEEKRKDIANAVVVKDSLDIEESPVRSLGELLANEPGIDWRTRGNYGGASEELHIRGMSADGTQVMVNGVVLNSPSYGSADVGQLPLNSIERIEVVKGPGSVLYGSGAMGGTVNILTKRPSRDAMAAKASAGYGSEATYGLEAEQGMYLGDLGYYLTASRRETDGFRDNSDLEHTDASLNLVYDLGENLAISLYNDIVDREYGLPGPLPPAGTMDYYIGADKFYNSEASSLVNRGEDRNHRSGLELKGRATDWLDLRLKGDYSGQESFNLTRYPWSGSGEETTVDNTIAGIEANAFLHPLSWLEAILGGEYRDFTYENEQQSLDTSGGTIPGAVSQGEHGVHTLGSFAQLTVSPFSPLKLIAGVRYEEHSTFGGETVPRFGLVLNPWENTTFKANHGKHFKAPTMNDLFWPDDGFAKGNPDLEPETGWHTDVTVEQSLLEDRAFLTLSWFNWDISDKIDWAENPNAPTGVPGWNYWTPSNISTYRADGVELGGRVRPLDALTADLSLTLQDVEEEMVPGVARQARYMPEILLKAGLTHTASFGLTSTLTARYFGERPGSYRLDTDTEPQEELASYWTVDIQLEQELAENWRVSLVAANLLDEDYATFLASFTDQTTYVTSQRPYPGAGRSVFASLTYEF